VCLVVLTAVFVKIPAVQDILQHTDSLFYLMTVVCGLTFSKLKVATWNPRGMAEKGEELQTELQERKSDVAVIGGEGGGGEK
jgi:hypothetical protein